MAYKGATAGENETDREMLLALVERNRRSCSGASICREWNTTIMKSKT